MFRNDSSAGRCQGSSVRKVYQLMESSHTDIAVTEVKILLLTRYYELIFIFCLLLLLLYGHLSFNNNS